MNKELLDNEADWRAFLERHRRCYGIYHDEPPEHYPCVAVWQEYEDYNSQDCIYVEYVYYPDFVRDEGSA